MRINLFATRQKLEMDEPRLPAPRRENFPVFTIKEILVPVDFSEASRSAFGYGLTLATQSHAEIILLHVFEPVPPDLKVFEATFVDPSFRQQAINELEKWRSSAPSGVRINAIFRESKTVDREILNAAAELHADVIVMGRSGRKGLAHVFLGSTAEHVYKKARCAVLLAGPQESPSAS